MESSRPITPCCKSRRRRCLAQEWNQNCDRDESMLRCCAPRRINVARYGPQNPFATISTISGHGDFQRRFLPRQPSSTETPGQPAPIVLLAIVEVFFEVCGRNIRDET